MINELIKRFMSFDKIDHFVKAGVDSKYDWNIGIDSNGRKALKLRGSFSLKETEGTAVIGVQQFYKPDMRTIVFSLLNREYENQFYHFCSDLIISSESAKADEECYIIALRCMAKWKKMFKNNSKDLLSSIQVMGLLAEITFLKDVLIPEYGEAAIAGWTGPEYTKKDFSIGEKWYEIKSYSKGKNFVHISSIDQLDGPGDGFLVVYPMEKMSAMSDATGLNELVQSVYESCCSEKYKELFFEKVSSQGFVFNDYYDNHKYRISEKQCYGVKEGFPRITRSNVDKAVLNAEYDIDLNCLEEFAVCL